MARLFSIIFALTSTVLVGCLIIALLVIGYDTAKPIIGATLLGFFSAMPIAWLIAGKLYTMK